MAGSSAHAAPSLSLRSSGNFNFADNRIVPLAQTQTLGYTSHLTTTAPLQPAAATYFRGDVMAAVQPLVPPSLPSGASASANAANAPGGGSPSDAIKAFMRSHYGSDHTRVAIYEESIATGHFKRVSPDGSGSSAGGHYSLRGKFLARMLRTAGSGANNSGSGDDITEDLSSDIEFIIQRGCTIAQGLLAGVMLVIIMQIGTATGDVAIVQTAGPALQWFRFTAYVLGMISWLGSAHALMQLRSKLGRYLPPFRITAPSEALLASSSRWLYISVAAYTLFMLATHGSMPLDNALRTASLRSWSATVIGKDATLLLKAQAWRALAALRFAAAIVGWIASSFGLATPYEQMHQLADAESDEGTAQSSAADTEASDSGNSTRVASAGAAAAVV
jgi:hypothetical protein